MAEVKQAYSYSSPLDCLLQDMQALLGHHDAANAAAGGGVSQLLRHHSAAHPEVLQHAGDPLAGLYVVQSLGQQLLGLHFKF